MQSLKLYGVPLSQPFRSVAWLMLLNKKRFDIELTVPGMSTKIGSKHESYLTKSRGRTSKIPLLQDGDLTIAESPVMMSYLCERYKWDKNWYGAAGSERKVTIDWYMHWHHTGIRHVARLLAPLYRPEIKADFSEEKDLELAHEALKTLDTAWLSSEKNFIVDEKPSIADLLAYEEIAPLIAAGIVPRLKDQYPHVKEWIEQMKKLPFHQEVHLALETLGDLNVSSDLPLRKRLAVATKKGLKSLMDAQHDFESTSRSKL